MIASKDGGASLDPGSKSTVRHASRWTTLADDALQSALERTRNWLVDRQSEEGFWVGELEGDTILESEYILLMAFLDREREMACLGCAPVHSGSTIRGRRLGDLPWRPDRRERLGQGLLRAEARRRFAGRSIDAASAPGDSRRGRCSRVQQLHAVLPGAARSDRLRRMPARSSRGRADPRAVEFQPARDVGLDANDRRATFDHVLL